MSDTAINILAALTAVAVFACGVAVGMGIMVVT